MMEETIVPDKQVKGVDNLNELMLALQIDSRGSIAKHLPSKLFRTDPNRWKPALESAEGGWMKPIFRFYLEALHKIAGIMCGDIGKMSIEGFSRYLTLKDKSQVPKDQSIQTGKRCERLLLTCFTNAKKNSIEKHIV